MTQHIERLVDHVLRVGACLSVTPLTGEALGPPGVAVYVIAGASSMISEVLDGEPKAPRPGRADHEPGGAHREGLGVEGLAEALVVERVVTPAQALLGPAGRTARLEDRVRAT